MIVNWPGGLLALQAAVGSASAPITAAPKDWAEAWCRIVATDGFYPVTHKRDPDDGQRWSTTVVQRLAAASARLAAALNASSTGR